jgi:hypothetical protein
MYPLGYGLWWLGPVERRRGVIRVWPALRGAAVGGARTVAPRAEGQPNEHEARDLVDQLTDGLGAGASDGAPEVCVRGGVL